MLAAQNDTIDLDTNDGRRCRELMSLCAAGPVAVWLVADGARWSFTAALSELRSLSGPQSEPHLVPLRSLSRRSAR
jgi:hypothetical protein